MEAHAKTTPQTTASSSASSGQPAIDREQDGEAYNRRQRERHQARLPNVGKRRLALFRKNADREKRLGITGHVVCRECGAKLKTLVGGAWPHLPVHGMSIEAYRNKWPAAPLVCVALRKDLSRRAKKQAESMRGRSRVGLKSVKGHKGEPPAKKWPIICLLADGYSYAAAGHHEHVNRGLATVQAVAEQTGIAGRRCLYDFGEPFTADSLFHVKAATGLSAGQFAKQVGAARPVIEGAVRSRREGQRIRPELARKVIAWRDGRIHDLLPVVSKPERGQDKYSGSRILKTLFPSLRTIRKLVLQSFRQCRGFLNANPGVGMDGLGEWLCEQAMREVAENSRKEFFVRFLPLAAEKWMRLFLEANLHRLHGSGDLWPLANEAIGSRWGAKPTVVAGALKSRARTIPRRELGHLIIARVPLTERPGPKRASRGGRRPGMTKDRIQEAQRLEELVQQFGGGRGAFKKACFEVYKGLARDLAYDRGRQTRKDWIRAGKPKP